MIRTGEALDIPLARDDGGAPMPAGIEKRANRAIFAAHDNDGFSEVVDSEKITWIGNTGRIPYYKPILVEDTLDLAPRKPLRMYTQMRGAFPTP